MDIVTYTPTMDCALVSEELSMDVDYVERYFKNYSITHVMPIRTLDYQETMFVKAIKFVKKLSKEEYQSHLEAFGFEESHLIDDPLILERSLCGFHDEHHYNQVIKYSKFILEPALLYDNYQSPMLDRLTLEQEVMLLTNIALGRGYNGLPVAPRDRMAALDMLTQKPIVSSSAASRDELKALSIHEMRAALEMARSGALPSPSSEDEVKFKAELALLKEKRDGLVEDKMLIEESEQSKIDEIVKVKRKTAKQ